MYFCKTSVFYGGFMPADNIINDGGLMSRNFFRYVADLFFITSSRSVDVETSRTPATMLPHLFMGTRTDGVALADGDSHFRRDLAAERVGDVYPYRSDDDIGFSAPDDDGVFSRRGGNVRAFEHIRRRNAVRADGVDVAVGNASLIIFTSWRPMFPPCPSITSIFIVSPISDFLHIPSRARTNRCSRASSRRCSAEGSS